MIANDDYWNHQMPAQSPVSPIPSREASGKAQPAAQGAQGQPSAQAQQAANARPMAEDQLAAQAAQTAQAQAVQDQMTAQAAQAAQVQPAAQPAQAQMAQVQLTAQSSLTAQGQRAAQTAVSATQAQQAAHPASGSAPSTAPVAAAAASAASGQQSYAQTAAPSGPAAFVPAPAPARRQSFNAQQTAGGIPSGTTAPMPQSGAYSSAAQYGVVPVQQKKSHGWIVALVLIVCLFGFMAFCVKACADSMNSFSSMSVASGYGLDGLDGDAIAVLDIDGVIQYDGSACSPEGLKKLLDEAQKNENVKALVLRVNSGGGTATAGEEMAEYLKQFEKPVVVSSASINASAAYEISSQADYIYVAKSTEIGSIGTAMEVTDLSGLMEKLGIKMDTITSSDSKDSSYGYRPLTDEERAYYQDMIDQINEVFIQNVAEGRHMDVEKVRELATGLVFTGLTAVDNGLADAVGTREDAIAKAAELAGITDYTTRDLALSSYDFGDFAYLFGEDRSSVEDLKMLLEELQADGGLK